MSHNSTTRVWSRMVISFTRLPPIAQTLLGFLAAVAAILFIRFIFHESDSLFAASEAIHAAGIAALIYKLRKQKTCAGLSLKSQEVTALFLAVRLYCSFVLECNIHTLLDTATLLATLWVIYMMRFDAKLKATYMSDLDDFRSTRNLVLPCALLACFVHPSAGGYFIGNRILWAFCVYLESVSVVPQLRVMQNTKAVEPFTARYVFALGVSRFLGCAHWVIEVLDTRGSILSVMGGGLWPVAILLAELVQTFILADFCYYYAKSVMYGNAIMLPSSNKRSA